MLETEKKTSINKIKKSEESPKEEKYQGFNTGSRKYYIKTTIKKKKKITSINITSKNSGT
jgi:hypothetical protein